MKKTNKLNVVGTDDRKSAPCSEMTNKDTMDGMKIMERLLIEKKVPRQEMRQAWDAMCDALEIAQADKVMMNIQTGIDMVLDKQDGKWVAKMIPCKQMTKVQFRKALSDAMDNCRVTLK